MFNTARLKLTAWYLLTIMFVSVSFSCIIYRGLTQEVERFARVQRVRFFHDLNGGFTLVPPNDFDTDLVNETKQRIILSLVVVNGIILVSSGGLGYFLAGKTLKPIAEMVEEQNQFISDASHELRTPLTSLKTAMEVGLRDKKIDLDSAKKIISESIDEVNKLQSLSEGLLQISQYQKPNGNMEFEKLSLAALVREAVSKMKPVAGVKKIQIKNQVKNGIVKGNRYSLHDLLVIVLDNAIKYSSENTIINIDAKKNPKNVTVSIKDTGIGIDEKSLPRVFDRFYRADRARTKSTSGGYGLGLSIAKRIIDLHKGNIYINSKVGKGTTVNIELPVFS